MARRLKSKYSSFKKVRAVIRNFHKNAPLWKRINHYNLHLNNSINGNDWSW